MSLEYTPEECCVAFTLLYMLPSSSAESMTQDYDVGPLVKNEPGRKSYRPNGDFVNIRSGEFLGTRRLLEWSEGDGAEASHGKEVAEERRKRRGFVYVNEIVQSQGGKRKRRSHRQKSYSFCTKHGKMK
jgi:hypothetical protein